MFKSNRKPHTLSVLGLMGTMVFAAPVKAKDKLMPKKPFRAEMIVSYDSQDTPLVMFHSKAKMRIEMSQNGQDVVQIIDTQAGEAFMLMDMAGEKRAMKLNIEDAMKRFGVGPGDLGRPTGRKKLAGYKCETYDVEAGSVCLTNHNIALESISPEGISRVTKLDIGRQKASLFAVPSNYTVMDLSGLEGLGAGMGSDMFKDRDSIINSLLGNLGIDDQSGILHSLNAIADPEDDDAAGQAALEALLGRTGLPKATQESINSDMTTADVLTQGLDGLLFKDNAEREAAVDMAEENQRLSGIVQKEGMAGLLRQSGMSEAEITELLASMDEMQVGLNEHAEKMRAQEKINQVRDASTARPDSNEIVSIEDEEAAMEAKIQRVLNDGVITEEESEQLEQEARDSLSRLLGGK